MTFHVGQKVVCVKQGLWSNEDHGQHTRVRVAFPRHGDVLIIRTITHNQRGTFLRFEELLNPILDYSEGRFEIEFASHRFRPLIERKTDISIFTAMLNPSHDKVQA